MSEERFDRIEERLDRLESGQADLRTGMADLRTDVADLRTDVVDLRRHMLVLHEQVIDTIKAIPDPVPQLERMMDTKIAGLREEIGRRLDPLEHIVRTHFDRGPQAGRLPEVS